MISKTLAAAVVAVSLSLCVHGSCRQDPTSLARAAGMVPDLSTRRLADSIDEREIAYLSFGGAHLIFHGDAPLLRIRVTDRGLIHTFLEALRHAYGSPGQIIGNRVDTMRIHLRPEGGHEREPLAFDFFAPDFSCGYGPEFQAALGKLSRYRAQQIAEYVREHRTDIQAVDFLEFRVTDAKEVGRILEALGHLDSRAFAFTQPRTANFDITLVLKGGATYDLVCIFPSISEPNVSAQKGVPFPAVLWDYYRKTW